MKKKKENKTVTSAKMAIVTYLTSNNFRCKDDNGNYMSLTETDDILMSMPISSLEHIKADYQYIIDERIETQKSIEPLYKAVMHKTGLSHFVGL